MAENEAWEAVVSANDQLIVAIGALVEVEWDGGGRAFYSIGAEGESDLAEHIIGADAPLARAIVGARAGEARTYWAGRRLRTVTVLRVGGAMSLV